MRYSRSHVNAHIMTYPLHAAYSVKFNSSLIYTMYLFSMYVLCMYLVHMYVLCMYLVHMYVLCMYLVVHICIKILIIFIWFFDTSVSQKVVRIRLNTFDPNSAIECRWNVDLPLLTRVETYKKVTTRQQKAPLRLFLGGAQWLHCHIFWWIHLNKAMFSLSIAEMLCAKKLKLTL